MDTKWMSIKEFRNEGYLQEVNRQFLHPLGLSLAIQVDNENDYITLAGIIDDRDDPEGIIFDYTAEGRYSSEELNDVWDKATNIHELQLNKQISRIDLFGYTIEPLP